MTDMQINVAATCVGTNTLGPGYRSVLWVQGCLLHCSGCISPEWIPNTINKLVSTRDLAKELTSIPQITGITISGGEPMLQAGGLVEMIDYIQSIRAVDLICFSGYRYEILRTNPPNSSVSELLSRLDLLIDGPYIDSMNQNIGFRGSTNQRYIHLTERFILNRFEKQPRNIEYHVKDGQLLMVGIPPKQVSQIVDSNIMARMEEGRYVRT